MPRMWATHRLEWRRMKEETLAKALDLHTEITQARGVVKVLFDRGLVKWKLMKMEK